MVCSICQERFTAPVSLPCGHIFCRECIRRAVEAIQACTMEHFCPTCRRPYHIVAVDPALVPPYLRPLILPTIRPVFFDDPTPEPVASASTSAKPSDSEVSAETHALRASCETWRRRAEVHAAGNVGLLGFARATKDYALRMRAERDEALARCAVLERKLSQLMFAAEMDAFAPDQGRLLHAEIPAVLEPEPPAHELMSSSPFAPPMSPRSENPGVPGASGTGPRTVMLSGPEQ
ncbi:hypothetical protein B0H19DRAFT_983791, partial [Mycena capillaripes]